jgi:hypothetical protein
MSTELVASLIALAGVIISVLVSFVVGQRQIKTQMDSLRIQIEQTFTSKLYEKRLEVYPLLFEIMSSFSKRIRDHGEITKEIIDDFAAQFYEWDSKNSIYTSGLTLKQLMRMMRLIKSYKNSSDEKYSKRKLRSELIPQMLELELMLKTELGVFSREGYHNPKVLEALRKERSEEEDE